MSKAKRNKTPLYKKPGPKVHYRTYAHPRPVSEAETYCGYKIAWTLTTKDEEKVTCSNCKRSLV